MIEKILTAKEGEGSTDCIAFGNADGKRWVMPRRRMRMAMNLYQPSSRKGRMLKQCLNNVLTRKLVLKKIKAKTLKYKLDKNVEKIISSVFNSNNLRFALYASNPGQCSKIVLQIYQDDRLLGYCKFTDRKKVAELFDHEISILTDLNTYFDNIPNVLYRGCVNGMDLFIQTTNKKNSFKVINHITPNHIRFVEDLYEHTHRNYDIKDTDYYKYISYYNHIYTKIPTDHAYLIKDRISQTLNLFGNNVDFGYIHGDFTPWNTYFQDNTLFCFDFEYAGRSFPKYFDLIHFYIRTAILDKQEDSLQICQKLEKLCIDYPEIFNPLSIVSYILFIISFAFMNEPNKFNYNDHSYKIWMSILKYFK